MRIADGLGPHRRAAARFRQLRKPLGRQVEVEHLVPRRYLNILFQHADRT
jgi:hypothetical protein